MNLESRERNGKGGKEPKTGESRDLRESMRGGGKSQGIKNGICGRVR